MNKAPEHYRPFDLKQAQAGAPYGLTSGSPVRIVCWDRKVFGSSLPIIILKQESNGAEVALSPNYDGTIGWSDDKLVMLPLFMLDGKPVFTGDRLLQTSAHPPFHKYEIRANPGIIGWGKLSWPPVPKVKHQIWQARFKNVNGTGQFITNLQFSSREKCEEWYSVNSGGANTQFVKAELISSWEE